MPSGNEVKIFEEKALDRIKGGVAVEAGFLVLEIGSGPLELFISQRLVSRKLKVSMIRIIRKIF